MFETGTVWPHFFFNDYRRKKVEEKKPGAVKIQVVNVKNNADFLPSTNSGGNADYTAIIYNQIDAV